MTDKRGLSLTSALLHEQLEVGTRHGRSKSMDTLDERESGDSACTSRRLKWPELSLIKTLSPVVLCVLPSSSLDFVGSALLAVGASPVFPEDACDVERELNSCKAVVVDTSARKELVEAVIAHYVTMSVPLVLNPMQAGTADTKKDLAQRVIEKCDPAAVSGRMGDIYALAESLIEKDTGILSPSDLVGKVTKFPTKEKLGARDSSGSSGDEDKEKRGGTCMAKQVAPVMKIRTARSPSPFLHRNKTPLVLKKGHFRDQSMRDLSVGDMLEWAQKLAARNATIVHVYEPNILTSGEFFMEINNTLLGMQNILSAHQCATAIIGAALACVEEQGDQITLEHCSHAVGFFTVAAEDASLAASKDSQIILPGTHRSKLIDFLYSLDEHSVRHQATLIKHNKVPV